MVGNQLVFFMKKVLLTLIFAALVSTTGSAMEKLSEYAHKAKSSMGGKMPSSKGMMDQMGALGNKAKGLMGGMSKSKKRSKGKKDSSMMGNLGGMMNKFKK